MKRQYKRGHDPRPCQNDMFCQHEYFDYSENCSACDIDFDGTLCPYIRPYGRQKYAKEQEARNRSRILNKNKGVYDEMHFSTTVLSDFV